MKSLTCGEMFKNVLKRRDCNCKINLFIFVKDLAKKFALLLGVNTNADSTRKSTIIIHRYTELKIQFLHSVNNVQCLRWLNN